MGMNDFNDFSDEELEIDELPERDEMLSLGLGVLGINVSLGLTGLIGL
jgi:hypothetical protein